MPSNFAENEWEDIEKYVEVLAPIKEATVLMSGDSYPTLSQYMPVIEMLKMALSSEDAMKVDENSKTSDPDDFDASLYVAIRQRFQFVDSDNDPLVFAMLLDPRFKDRFLTTSSEKRNIMERIKIHASSWVMENSFPLPNANITYRKDCEGNFLFVKYA